jgi:hypothetical protein
MAKLSSVPNSNTRLPAKFWRDSSHAVSRPMAAVIGAATSAITSVVVSDCHAAPTKCRPRCPPSIGEGGQESGRA